MNNPDNGKLVDIIKLNEIDTDPEDFEVIDIEEKLDFGLGWGCVNVYCPNH